MKRIIAFFCAMALLLTSGFPLTVEAKQSFHSRDMKQLFSESSSNDLSDKYPLYEAVEFKGDFRPTDINEQSVVGVKMIGHSIYSYDLATKKTASMEIQGFDNMTSFEDVRIKGKMLVWYSTKINYVGNIERYYIHAFKSGDKSITTVLDTAEPITFEGITENGIAYNQMGYVWYYDWATKKAKKVAKGSESAIGGDIIAYVTEAGNIAYASVSNLSKSTTLDVTGKEIGTNGREIFYFHQNSIIISDRDVRAYDLKDKQEKILAKSQGGAYDQKILPGGRYAIWVYANGAIKENTHFYHLDKDQDKVLEFAYTPVVASDTIGVFERNYSNYYIIRYGDDSKKDLKELKLSENSVDLEVGESVTMNATAKYANGDEEDVTADVEWSSDNKEIATVDAKGQITGGKSGETIIRAKYEGKTAKVAVTVSEEGAGSSSSYVVGEGQTVTFKLSGGRSPYKATSSDSKIAKATISKDVLSIKGVKEGTAVITLVDAKKNSVEIKVKVEDLEIEFK